MEAYDCLGKAETQPGTGLGTAFFQPHETFRRALTVRRVRNAWPVVRNDKANLLIAMSESHGDARANCRASGVFNRVVDHIRQSLPDELAVAVNDKRTADAGLERDADILGRRFIEFDDIAHRIGQIDL